MKTPAERHAWAVAICRAAQMRLTSLRQAMLRFLAEHYTPVTLETISHAQGVAGHCDGTTVYRTLVLFKDAGIVRRVGSARKEALFWLNSPAEGHHLIICRECGRNVLCQLAPVTESQIATAAAGSGFALFRQDYEIHSLCPECQAARQRAGLPSKLMAVNRVARLLL